LLGYCFDDLIGKKVLIKGGVGSGKTSLTADLLNQAMQKSPIGSITIIEMAPPKKIKQGKHIGGELLLPNGDHLPVIYLKPPKIWAPRLEGRTREGVIHLAKENANSIGLLLNAYLAKPTLILFMNDLTIYLHAGRLRILLNAISAAATFIGNAYEGSFFEDMGSSISLREKKFLRKVEEKMDRIITI